jgi:autotransporter-associated beta strand protein
MRPDYLPTLLGLVLTGFAHAAVVTKDDNTTNLNVGSSWVGGVAPGASDTALWDATVTAANTVSLGGNTVWAGLTLANPGGDVAIIGANTLAVNGTLDLGITRNLRLGNTESGQLNFNNTVLTGSTTLTFQKTTDTATASFNSANALNFTGTLQLRGSTPSTTPGSMQGGTGRFWLDSPNGSQASGTAFALDTGAAANNGQDVILGNWNSSGTRTLTLSSLSGFGTLRTDSGTTGVRNLVVDQAGTTTFNGMILSHHSGGGALRNIAFEKRGAGTLTLAGVVGSQTASSGGSSDSLTVKVAGGTLVLAASNTYRAGTLISAGSAVAASNNAFGTAGTITLNDGSTGASATSVLIDSSGGTVTVARPIVVDGSGSGLVTLGTLASSGSFQSTFGGAITLNRSVTLQGAPAGGDRTQFTGGISGTGDVSIGGNQRVILLGAANTFNGDLFINAGSILQLSDGTSTGTSFIPDAASVSIGAGAALRLAKGNNSETIDGLSGSGSVSAISGINTLVVGAGNATSAYSGNLIQSGGTLTLTKSGTGTLTLSGSNSYTGTTLLNAGTLVAAGGNAIGDSSIVNMNGGALQLNASETTGLLMGAGGLVNLQNHTLTVNQNAHANLAADIAGTGTLIKSGSSQLRPAFVGASGFSGTFQIDAGLLVLIHTGVEDGQPNLHINSSASSAGLVLGGNFAGQTATLGNLSGLGGQIRVDFDAPTAPRTLAVNQTSPGTFSGALLDASGGRVLALTKNGAATLTLNTNAATYSGDTTLNQGILEVSGGNAIGNSSAVILANTSGVTLRLLSSETIDGLQGGGGSGGNVQLNAHTLTVGAGGASATYSGTLSGSGGLAKAGGGTQTLDTTHSFTGPTALTGGTLRITTGNEQTLGNNPGTFNPAQLFLNGGTLQISNGSLTLDDANRGLTVGTGGGTVNVDSGLALNIARPVAGGLSASALSKSGAGTVNLTAAASHNALFVNEGRWVQQSGESVVNTTLSGGLTVVAGAGYELNGGVLRTDRIVAGGDFVWGAGTLAHRAYGSGSNLNLDLSAKFDHSQPGFQAVKSGTSLSFEGSLTSSSSSQLRLHGSPSLYLSGDLLFDNLRVSGDLNLTQGGALEVALNPYLLRPFSNTPGAFEAGSLPLVIVDGNLTGTFSSFSGVLDDGRGFVQDTSPSFPGLGSLPIDSWFLEYRAGVSGADLFLPHENDFAGTFDVVFFHYKVSAYVPEPSSFTLLLTAAFGFRLFRRKPLRSAGA